MQNLHRTLDSYLAGDINSVSGWFAYVDAEMFRAILAAQGGILDIHGACAEIGVHHGKSFVALCLGMRSNEKAYCIDIFSDQYLNKDKSGRGERGIFESNLWRFGICADKYIIRQASSLEVTSSEILNAVGPVRFFSIDGGHWHEVVTNDLSLAEETLCAGGVIALDDFCRPEWPDVSSGYFSWHMKRKRDIVPFAVGFNKIFLCEARFVGGYQSSIMNNKILELFFVKSSAINGSRVFVYSLYMLPEFSIRRRALAYLRIYNPKLYVLLKRWFTNATNRKILWND